MKPYKSVFTEGSSIIGYLLISKEGQIYGYGKTAENAIKDYNDSWYSREYGRLNVNDFDIYGNLIGKNGAPIPSNKSEWRLIEAKIFASSERDILGDTPYEEI